MSNYAWVCFQCRLRVRRHGQARNVRCQSCARPSECLGYKVPVPPRAKVREWEKLRANFYHLRQQYALAESRRRVRSIHDLEREIARLEAMPRNRGRAATIKYLKNLLVARV